MVNKEMEYQVQQERNSFGDGAQNRKLKIGILSFYYPHLGGSGIVTSRLASFLASLGHEIHFIGYDNDVNPQEMQNLGIFLHKVKKVDYPCIKNEPYTWSLASVLCNVDKEYDLDLVHANYAIPHAASAYLAREQRKKEGKYLPYVVTGHGSDIHTNGSKDEINPILKLALEESDSLTFVSSDLKKVAEDSLGVSREKGIHIPNFVDTEHFYEGETNLRERLGIPENAFVISHVSNFAPVKQVYHFAKLAEYFQSEDTLSNVYFILGGDGRDRSVLEQGVDQLGVKSHFRFLGKVQKDVVREIYNASDLVLLPSKHEGNPLIVLEAMACKRVVAGSDVGGIRELIDDSELLFQPGNIEELAKIIHDLRNNEFKARQKSHEGYRKVQEEYSVEQIIKKYYNVFRDLVR